jgi:hypothetical protein
MAQDPSGSSKDPKGKQKGESAQPTGGPSAGGPSAGAQAGPPIDPEQLKQILQALAAAGGLPIAVTQTPPTEVDLRLRLKALLPVTVAFPPCSDVLLALINTQPPPTTEKDDITKFFEEYFTFDDHGDRVPAPEQLAQPGAGPGASELPLADHYRGARGFVTALAVALVPATVVRDAQRQPTRGATGPG